MDLTCPGNTGLLHETFPRKHSSLKTWFNLSFTFLVISTFYRFWSISHYRAFQLKTRQFASVENLFEHSVKSTDAWQRIQVGQNAKRLICAQFGYYKLFSYYEFLLQWRLASLKIRKFLFPDIEFSSLHRVYHSLLSSSVRHPELRQCYSLVALHPTPKGPEMLLAAGPFMRRPNLQSIHKCNIH